MNPTTKDPRSFLVPRNPSIDRRYRPHPDPKIKKLEFENIVEDNEKNGDSEYAYDADEETSCGTSMGACSNNSGKLNVHGNENNDSAHVYLRLRPILKNESLCSNYKISGNIFITTSLTDTNPLKHNLEKHFKFTNIFDETCLQCDMYNNCVRSQIESEQDFTIMTYGTSGSGKTFTLLGDLQNPGIIFRSLENIFILYNQKLTKTPSLCLKRGKINIVSDNEIKEAILKRKILLDNNCNEIKSQYDELHKNILSEHQFGKSNNDKLITISIWISFIEVYNEITYDLLTPDTVINQPIGNAKKIGLKIFSNDSKVYINNLTSVYVTSSLEAYKLLMYGLKKISYASTAINTNSSRSHSIFFVDCLKYYLSGDVIHNSYKFCDLAGSERLGKTNNIGSRLKEAKRINTSLMVLGRCLDVAYSNQSKKNHDVIPFRDSKLTVLLQSALLGKEKISMIVNITPTENFFEENMNALNFSSIAKNIKQLEIKADKRKLRYSMVANSFSQNNQGDLKIFEENISLRAQLVKAYRLLEQTDEELKEKVLNINTLEDELRQAGQAHYSHLKNRLNEYKESSESNIQLLKRAHEIQIENLTKQYERKLLSTHFAMDNDSIEIIDESDDSDNDDDD